MTTQQNTINLVRAIMRAKGKTRVWNNWYRNTVRTVKCYRDRDSNKDAELQNVLHQTLNGLNIVHQIKFTEPGKTGPGGFIVRLQS